MKELITDMDNVGYAKRVVESEDAAVLVTKMLDTIQDLKIEVVRLNVLTNGLRKDLSQLHLRS